MVDLERISADDRAAMENVRFYDAGLLRNKDYEIVSVVEGHSCKNRISDPPASRTAAIEQLKYFAAKQEANGLSEVRCHAREHTSIDTNCWDLITCTANALSVDN